MGSVTGRIAGIVEAAGTEIAAWMRRGNLDRKRRAKREREFRREFDAYCRAHGLSGFCEDDWRSYHHYDR
jgi:hypothetical protein